MAAQPATQSGNLATSSSALPSAQTGRQKGIKIERQTDRQTKRMTLISSNLALKSALSITISLAKCSSCCMLGLSRDSCAVAPLLPFELLVSMCYLCCCLMALRLTHKLTSDREHEHTWNWDVLVPIVLSHPVSSGHKHKPQGSNVLYIQPWKTKNNIETTLIDGLIQFVGCLSHLPLSNSLAPPVWIFC